MWEFAAFLSFMSLWIVYLWVLDCRNVLLLSAFISNESVCLLLIWCLVWNFFFCIYSACVNENKCYYSLLFHKFSRFFCFFFYENRLSVNLRCKDSWWCASFQHEILVYDSELGLQQHKLACDVCIKVWLDAVHSTLCEIRLRSLLCFHL